MTPEAVANDFTEEERFTVEDTRSRASRNLRSAVMLLPVVAFLLLWFILNGLLLPAFGMEAGQARLWLAAGIAAVVMIGLVLLWLKLQRMGLEQSWLSVSPQGMRLKDGGITRELRWEQMTGIGKVKPMRGIEGGIGGSSAGVGQAFAAGVNRAAQNLSGSLGILGRGVLEADADNPLAQKVLAQNLGSWGTDASGTPLVGIAPDAVVDDWYQGRVGDWLRRFRPDLAAEYERQRG